MLNVRLPFSQCIRRSLLRLHIVCGFCGSATATEGKILLEQVSGPDQLPIYITWLIYLRFFIAQEILSTQAAWQKLHASFFSVASCLHRRDKYVVRAPGTIYTRFYALKSCIYSSKPQPWVYIKHYRNLSLPPGIYQIYTPAGVFDVWLKQDINI